MSDIRALVAGNWKMNGTQASLSEAEAVKARLDADDFNPNADVMICPPATLLAAMSERLSGSKVATGGEDCHAEASGCNPGPGASAHCIKHVFLFSVVLDMPRPAGRSRPGRIKDCGNEMLTLLINECHEVSLLSTK